MNQRIAIVTVVILVAAAGAMRERSPEVTALAGSYVASAGAGAPSFVLTLRTDASLTLRTLSADGRELANETGGWMLDGDAIQIAVSDPSDPSSAVAVTVERKDGGLVAPGANEKDAPFAGLVFERVNGGQTAGKPGGTSR
jgi:hypothetical protein